MPTAVDTQRIHTVSEAKARIVTGRQEAPVVPGRTTEEAAMASRSADLAATFRKKREETGSRAVLESWKPGEVPEVPSSVKAENVLEDNLADTSRRAKGEGINTVLRAIIDGDETFLSTDPGGTDPNLPLENFIIPLQDVMFQIPEFKKIADEIGALPTLAEQQAEWAKFILQQVDEGRAPGQNRFIDSLRTKYAAVINKDRPAPQSEEGIRATINSLDKKMEAIGDDSTGAIKRNADAMIRTQKLIESYDDTVTATEKGAILEKLEEEIAAAKPDFEHNTAELAKKDIELNRWLDTLGTTTDRGTRTSAERELDRLRGEIMDLKKNNLPYERAVARKKQMDEEREGLTAKYNALSDKSSSLVEQKVLLNKQKIVAEMSLSELGSARVGTEEEFLREMQGIIGSAFKDTMTARYDAETTGVDTALDEMIKDETDPHIKASVKAGKKRWGEWREKRDIKKLWLGKKEYKDFSDEDKDAVRQDMDTLLNSGPEAYMRRLLETENDPDQSVPTLYTTAKIDHLLEDKEFMKKAGSENIALLLRRAVGEKMLSEKRMEEISDTEWGKDALEAAIKHDKDLKHKIDEDKKADGKEHMSRIDWLKDKKQWGILAAMFMFLGPAGAGAYATMNFVRPPAASAHGEHA